MNMLATKVYAQELPPMDPNILYGKLENGLTYYIQKNTTPKKKLALNLVVKAGSLMESENQLGLAHLLEHMAFNGSKNFPKNSIDDYFNSIGLSLGAHFNASTSFETTNYKFEIPTDKSGAVEKGIHILSDIVSNLDLSDEAFERERKIVEEEWRGDLGIRDRHFEQVGKLLFNNSRYFYRKPIGNIETIRTFTYEEGRKFYNDWYQPSSIAVFAVGDIEPQEVKSYIEKYFTNLKNTKEVVFPSHSIPNFDKNKFIVFQDEKKDYLSFAILEKRDYVKINSYENSRINLIHEIALHIFQKRLLEVVHRENSIMLSGDVSLIKPTRDSFYHYAYAILDDDKIFEGIEELLTSMEIAKRFGFTKAELERVKQELLIDYEQSAKVYSTRSSKNYITEYIRHFTEEEEISGAPAYAELTKQVYPSITLEEVNDYFAKAFNATNRLIEITAPKKIKVLPTEKDIDDIFTKVKTKELTQNSFNIKDQKLITKELKSGTIVKKKYLQKLDITKIELSNGATVYLKPTTFKKDSIRFKIRSMGGHSKATMQQLPSAHHLDSVLDISDLGEFSITDLNNVLPRNYVDVKPMLGSLFEGFDGKAISKYQEELFQMIYLNFTDRRMSQSVIDNYKKIKLEEWNNEKDLPLFKIRKLFFKSFYQDHPRHQWEVKEEILKTNLKDLNDLYKNRFSNAGDFSFIFVGDFDLKQLEEYSKKYIGSLPFSPGQKKEKFVDHGYRINKKRDLLVIREENAAKSSQSRYYNKNIKNNPKNRQIYGVLISILTEILKDEIRERLNMVYSINAGSFDTSKYPEELFTLVIQYESSPDNVAKINKEIDIILNNIKEGSFDTKVLKEKKIGLIDSYKQRMNENSFWTYALNEYIQNEEPLENVLTIEEIINRITLQDITDLAKKIFDENYIETSLYLEGS